MPYAETRTNQDLNLVTPPVVVIAKQGGTQLLLGRIEQLNDPTPKPVAPIHLGVRASHSIRQAVMRTLTTARVGGHLDMGWFLPSPEQAAAAIAFERQLPAAIVVRATDIHRLNTRAFAWVDPEKTLETLAPEHRSLVTDALDNSDRLQSGRPNLKMGYIPIVDQPLSLQAGQDPATYATAWRIESAIHTGMPNLRRAVLDTASRSITGHDCGSGRPTPFDLYTIRIAIAGPDEARSITDQEVKGLALLTVGISLMRKRSLVDAYGPAVMDVSSQQVDHAESPFSLQSVRAALLRLSTDTSVWDSYSAKHPTGIVAELRTFADAQLRKLDRGLTD